MNIFANRLLHSFRLTILLACVSLAQPFAALAQTNTPAPLPLAAQEALNKGILAAKLPDYLLAIRFFEEARKAAPQAAIIYLNMGLAESKIPGRELRAIAWFGAYLAANPGAPNATAVKEQIAMLDVKNQSNVSRLIQTLQDSSANNRSRIETVAKLWADSGDIATALKIARLAGEIYGCSAQSHIAAVQANAGDMAGALKTAEMVVMPDYRTGAFLGIAAIQFERGDPNGAETTIALARRAADHISDGQTKWIKLGDIAQLQIKAGRMDGAQATLRAALTAVELIEIPVQPDRKGIYLSARAQGQAFIADNQIAAGDVAGAKQSLALAFKNSELIDDPDARSRHQGMYIFEYYAKAGDVSNAIKVLKAYQKSVDLISDANRKSIFTGSYDSRQNVLANLQMKLGGFDQALQTAHEITNVNIKTMTLGSIIDAQVKAGDYRGAVKTSGEIVDANKKSYNLLQIVKAQARARDFDSGVKNAELIQNTEYKEWAVRAIAEERAKANAPVVPTPVRTTGPAVIKPLPAPAMTAADWIKMLDSDSRYDVALNTEPFLSLAGYLKSLPPSDNPHKVFESLHETAKKIVGAQKVISGMLKQQAGK